MKILKNGLIIISLLMFFIGCGVSKKLTPEQKLLFAQESEIDYYINKGDIYKGGNHYVCTAHYQGNL